jgi:hypothetical protein
MLSSFIIMDAARAHPAGDLPLAVSLVSLAPLALALGVVTVFAALDVTDVYLTPWHRRRLAKRLQAFGQRLLDRVLHRSKNPSDEAGSAL